MVEEISEAEFVAAYMDTHSGKTGETLSSNAKRLFKWLKENGYIKTKEE